MKDLEQEIKRLKKQLAKCKEQRDSLIYKNQGFPRIKKEMIQKLNHELDLVTASDEPAMKKDFTIGFGYKYKNRKISEIPKLELKSYISFLSSLKPTKGTVLEKNYIALKRAFDEYYRE